MRLAADHSPAKESPPSAAEAPPSQLDTSADVQFSGRQRMIAGKTSIAAASDAGTVCVPPVHVALFCGLPILCDGFSLSQGVTLSCCPTAKGQAEHHLAAVGLLLNAFAVLIALHQWIMDYTYWHIACKLGLRNRDFAVVPGCVSLEFASHHKGMRATWAI